MTELEKAVKHFDGVWPKGWTNMIVSTIDHNDYGYGEYRDYHSSKDALESDLSSKYEHMWFWVCSKEKFMEAAKEMNLGDKNYWNGTDQLEVGHIVKQGEIVAVDGYEICIKDGNGLRIVGSSLVKPAKQIDLLWSKWIEMGERKNDAYRFGEFFLSEIDR